MSDAIKRLHDYLAKSPSVVYPEDVLAYLPAIEAENSKLRELLRAAYSCTNARPSCLECRVVAGGCTLLSAMRELGVEV